MTTVRQLLDRKDRAVFSVGPETPVLEAIRAMAEHHVGALLVMKGEVLAGIVSERDYARKVILRGRSSSDTPVRDIMTSPVLTVSPDTSVQQCMQLVTDKRVRHLPELRRSPHQRLTRRPSIRPFCPLQICPKPQRRGRLASG